MHALIKAHPIKLPNPPDRYKAVGSCYPRVHRLLPNRVITNPGIGFSLRESCT